MSDLTVPRTGLTMRPPFSLLMALALGAAFGLSTTYMSWWPLQLLSLAGLVVLAYSARAALTGWVFGLGWFCSSLWWLYISMHVYGFMPAWMAALAVLALSTFLALFPALAVGVWVRLSALKQSLMPPLVQPIVSAAAFASLWMLSEWLRSTLFTGFPWNATGYGHLDSPLAGFAPLLGVDGVNFIAAFCAGLLGMGFNCILLKVYNSMWALYVLISIILIGVYISGSVLKQQEWSQLNEGNSRAAASTSQNNELPKHSEQPTEPAKPAGLKIALIQGNVPQDIKFEPEGIRRGIAQHLEMIAAASGDLIITAETVIPVPDERLPEGLLLSLADTLRSKESAALVGIVLSKPDGGYTNSALGFNLLPTQNEKPRAAAKPGTPRNPAQYRYDKYHLVPFGEFIPWGFRWFINLMQIPLGDFARGPLNSPSFEVKAERIAPTICYEDVFGDELRARFADAAQAPTIIANLTNLAWFGDTFALDQHLAIARMRSVEFARPTVRATNTGATAVIDHHGQVTQQLKRHTPGVLNAQVQGRVGLTPYARWGSGWFLVMAVLLLMGLGFLRVKKRG
jgi:apolipoprotein N-acyltransferase